MRKVLLFVVLAASSACGTSDQWQKPGTDQSVVDGEIRQCRHDAQQESLRLFADWRPFAFDSPPFWNGRWEPTHLLVTRMIVRNQLQAEQALAVACMRHKGYVIAT